MFCKDCGCQNKDGAKFCRSCGSPLPDAKAGGGSLKRETGNADSFYQDSSVQSFYVPPKKEPSVQAAGGAAAASSPPPVSDASSGDKNSFPGIIRKSASSPVFFAGTVLFTAYLLTVLINLVKNAGGICDIWNSLGLGRVNTAVVILLLLLAVLPECLLAAGAWVVFVSAVKAKAGAMKTGGFGLVRAGSIISIIELCVFLAASEILVIAFCYEYSSYPKLRNIAVLIGAGILILTVLWVIFLVMVCRAARLSAGTVRGRAAAGRVNPFVSFMCFFTAALMLFLGLYVRCQLKAYVSVEFYLIIMILGALAYAVYGLVSVIYISKAGKIPGYREV